MKNHTALMAAICIGFITIFTQLWVITHHLADVSESLQTVKAAFIYE